VSGTNPPNMDPSLLCTIKHNFDKVVNISGYGRFAPQALQKSPSFSAPHIEKFFLESSEYMEHFGPIRAIYKWKDVQKG